ncbi:hypothetical protein F0562_017161 [Nyssa sinensis]|uniref:Uncharacterized protein n=1 Tax=Nyssa sinensis TaxID=561372 RepID=A0A5J4ZII5_9ASTE|nr:hypothetical protein F0562_017161 [Nyssa sinensis]
MVSIRAVTHSNFFRILDLQANEIQGLTSRFNPPDGNSNSILQSFHDLEEAKPLANGYSSQLPPHYPRQSSATQLAAMDSSYRLHFSVQNGYTAMRGVGNYRVGKAENMGTNGHEDGKLGDGNEDTQFYSSGYSFGSWNDSTHFTENFTGLKRELEDDELFAGTQNGELGNRAHILSHHLSLPKSSAEMAALQKLLQFQDSVPCKIRAKRGCATHPRSIAERVDSSIY